MNHPQATPEPVSLQMNTNSSLLKKPLYSAASCLLGAFLVTSASAQNLIVNGDFQAGNTGFASDYAYVAPTLNALIPNEAYTVHNQVTGLNPFFLVPFFDHTFGDASGLMMIANGSSDATRNVWTTTSAFSVTANTNYYFEAWANDTGSGNAAILSFQVFNADTASWQTIGNANFLPAGTWTPMSFTWNSGVNTTAELRLRNAQTAIAGNDFAVDDIYFGITSSINPIGPIPEPSSALLLVASSIGLFLRRRRK